MKKHLISILIAAMTLTGCITTGSYMPTSGNSINNSNIANAKDDYERYVLTYYPLAVEQMNRYGIPASITLAQGLLESGAGKSELARKSNNHFGIKADKSWNGSIVTSMDNGKLCKFRKYDKVGESYEDHSRFLVGRERYASLFKLKKNDYEGWAKGLKQAGYAEDSRYPQKLISLIERYELHRYDSYSTSITPPKDNGKPQSINGIPFVNAGNGERMSDVANRTGISTGKLRKYNDIKNNREPDSGERLYTKKKKSKAAKGSDFHTTKNGESLYSIAQEYGIRLMELYELNPQYKSYTKLKVGDVIRLR